MPATVRPYVASIADRRKRVWWNRPIAGGRTASIQIGLAVMRKRPVRPERAALTFSSAASISRRTWRARSAATLFYIDPPYWGHETDYGKGLFARDDFARMADLLRGLKGRFILSLNDRPEVRETFAGFRVEEVTTRYSANAKAARRVGELLIGNG